MKIVEAWQWVLAWISFLHHWAGLSEAWVKHWWTVFWQLRNFTLGWVLAWDNMVNFKNWMFVAFRFLVHTCSDIPDTEQQLLQHRHLWGIALFLENCLDCVSLKPKKLSATTERLQSNPVALKWINPKLIWWLKPFIFSEWNFLHSIWMSTTCFQFSNAIYCLGHKGNLLLV